jgi:hypothetical protein
MGFCMDSVGHVCVELRNESFKIHADYRDGALGEWWGSDESQPSHGHPEFMLADLDDLIAALQKAKAKLSGGAVAGPR